MAVLDVIGWLIAIVYSTIPCFWLVVHPWARRLGRARQPLFPLGAIWFAMWILAGLLTWRWREVALYRTAWSWLGAAPLLACGFIVYALAKRSFTADQLLGRTELHPDKHEQRLVTGGIRQFVRHPIYVGHFCELLAWSVGTGLAVLYGMSAFALITGLIMVRAEDRELEQRFGEAFRAYRERVPALIPRIPVIQHEGTQTRRKS
jgi:protein-S-isoprenylcysteine O-methyltransferase Ste14